MIRALEVAFDACGPDRSGPLMWGQVAIWDVLSWLPPGDCSLNQMTWLPVPDDRSTEQVTAALSALLVRHEALRSTFHEAAGTLTQTVAASGRLTLACESLGGEPAQEAARVGGALRDRSFDVGSGLPLRAALLLTADERPAALVIVASHLAVDGSSLRIVRSDLQTLLHSPGTLGPRARQPIDRALHERSTTGRLREERTVAHWDRTLRAMEPQTLRTLDHLGEARFEWGRMESPGAAQAVRRLAAASGVGEMAVLLAATVLVLAALTGDRELAFRSIVATRFQQEDAELVGAFNLNALLRLPVTEGTVRDFLRRVGNTYILSLRYCEAGPRQIDATIAKVGEEGDFTPGDYCFLNDVRYHERDAEAQSGDAAPATVITRFDSPNRQKGSKFFLYVRELSARCVLTLCVDRRFLPDCSVDAFLARLDDLLVREAGLGDVSRTVAESIAAVGRPLPSGGRLMAATGTTTPPLPQPAAPPGRSSRCR